MEDIECELTLLSKNCILHSLHVLSTKDEPKVSDVNRLCDELHEAVLDNKYKKKKHHLQQTVEETSLDIDVGMVKDFCEKKLSAEKFYLQIEERLVSECIRVRRDFDHDSLFRACWNVYLDIKQQDLMAVELLSKDLELMTDDHKYSCMYHLWVMFNAILSQWSKDMLISAECFHIIMKRLFDLCGQDCPIEELVPSSTSIIGGMTYLEYLNAIANYSKRFDLKSSLTCEIVLDVRGEIVDAVLKKSYLTKKGHRVRNWKRRWFVLRKTILQYFESKDKLVLKGQMIINDKTIVKEIANQGRKLHCFVVICGKTHKSYDISADDEKSRHGWIIAIKKARDLAKILLRGDEVLDVPESPSVTDSHLASNFYLIKFNPSHSIIPKWEGGVKYLFDVSMRNVSEDEDDEIPQSGRPRSKSIETLTELRSEESKRVSSFGSVDSLRNAVEIDSFIFQNYSVVVSSRKQPIPPQPGSCSSNFIHSNVSKSYMKPSTVSVQKESPLASRKEQNVGVKGVSEQNSDMELDTDQFRLDLSTEWTKSATL